jgi:hypothetical protein
MESGNQAEAAQPADQIEREMIEVKVARQGKKHIHVYKKGDKKKNEIKLPVEGWWKDERKGQAKQWYWMKHEGKDYYTAKLDISK